MSISVNYTAYVGTELGANTREYAIASVNMMPGSYAIKATTPTDYNTWLNGKFKLQNLSLLLFVAVTFYCFTIYNET